MKIAVTGSGGHIGRAFILHLLHLGYEVVGLSRTEARLAHPSYSHYCVDYRCILALEEALRGCHSVVHLAGLAHAPLLLRVPSYRLFHDANVLPTINLLVSASRAGVDRFVFISSISVYGSSSPGVIINDVTRPCPENAYAISKYVAECFVSEYCKSSSMKYVILRPPLVYSSNSPGNLSKLILLFRFLPVNIFSLFNKPKFFVSLANLLEALVLSCVSSGVVDQVFVISDPSPVSESLRNELKNISKKNRLRAAIYNLYEEDYDRFGYEI